MYTEAKPRAGQHPDADQVEQLAVAQGERGSAREPPPDEHDDDHAERHDHGERQEPSARALPAGADVSSVAAGVSAGVSATGGGGDPRPPGCSVSSSAAAELYSRVLLVRLGGRGRRLDELEEHSGDVVVAAGAVRGEHQRPRWPPRGSSGARARIASIVVPSTMSDRPSEQIRKMSPASPSTENASTSTSGSVPRGRRVITERCGCTSAASADSSPAPDELGDERVVVGSAASRSWLRKRVGARVADVTEGHAGRRPRRGRP